MLGTRPRQGFVHLNWAPQAVRWGRRMLFALAVAIVPAVLDAPARAESTPPMPPAVARADIALYADAFRAAARNNWSRAHRLARRAKDPLGATILRWWDYSSLGTRASFADIAQFIDEHPDWPDQRLLQINAESAMAKGVSDADVLAWYRWRDPISREGRLRHADALFGIGQEERAAALVRKTWVQGWFTGGSFARPTAATARTCGPRITSPAWIAWCGPITPARRGACTAMSTRGSSGWRRRG